MSIVNQFIESYERGIDYYEAVARIVANRCEDWLKENGIRAIVSYRAKSIDSLRVKVEYRNNREAYRSVEDVYADIVDLSGVRIAIYFPQDVERVHNYITSYFDCNLIKIFPQNSKIVESENQTVATVDNSVVKTNKKFSGYHARHFRVKLKPGEKHLERYTKCQIEIQVASVLMHAWSEVEHDLMYKPLSGDLSQDEKDILDQINGLVISGEIALNLLQKALIARTEENGRKFSNQYELAAFLFGSTKDGKINSKETQISRIDTLLLFLEKLGMDTPESLKETVEKVTSTKPEEPLVDSIAEELMSLSEENAQAYREVFTAEKRKYKLNDVAIPDIYEFGKLIKAWSLANDFLREVYTMREGIDEKKSTYRVSLQEIALFLGSSAKDAVALGAINEIRNRVLHDPSGDFASDVDSYKTYIEVLYKILERVNLISEKENQLREGLLTALREINS